MYYRGWDEWDHHSIVLEEGGVGLVKIGYKVTDLATARRHPQADRERGHGDESDRTGLVGFGEYAGPTTSVDAQGRPSRSIRSCTYGRERDLVDLVVGPAPDSRVAEQRVPADDPADKQRPEVVKVGQPDGPAPLLDGRRPASLILSTSTTRRTTPLCPGVNVRGRQS